MSDKDAVVKQKRMMNRSDFLKVFKLNKAIIDGRDEMNKMIEEMCDENEDKNWWPDKVNIAAGFVLVSPPASKEAPEEAPKTTSEDDTAALKEVGVRHRISAAWKTKLKAKGQELKEAREALERKVVFIAMACGVPTQYVNIGSGEITVASSNVTECPESKEEVVDSAAGVDTSAPGDLEASPE